MTLGIHTDGATATRGVAFDLEAKRVALTAHAEARRALPRRELRRVGPVVLFDHVGPSPAEARSMDVPAHGHAGMQVITYVLEGAMRHRDSLGHEHVLDEGDAGFLIAGRGAVHAERALPSGDAFHAITAWVALPRAARSVAPSFEVLPREVSPRFDAEGVAIRAIAGCVAGTCAPAPTYLDTTLLDVDLAPRASLLLHVEATHELAVYVVRGSVESDGGHVEAGHVARLTDGGGRVALASRTGARAFVFGGEPCMPVVVYGSFVADSIEQGRALEAAARDEALSFPFGDD